ncbi:hypothetical protein ABKV19_025629 [Rosa sericea]
MTSEVRGTSGQQFRKDATNHVPSDRSGADRDVDNICVQTGEEFSTEFLQDRIAQRRLAPVVTGVEQHQSKRVGFNLNQNNPQLVNEDLNGILGLRRLDSDGSSEFSDFVTAGTGYVPDLEKNVFPSSNVSRQYGGLRRQLSGKFADEVNRDWVIPRSNTPPFYVGESPQSYSPYGQGFFEGSFSFKMKFLCSFGGRILPRPNDGKLRYVGGDTRILSIHKGTNFEELMKKTLAICNHPHTIKYQLPGEELDALVSVCSDEDLLHMIEEYHELERTEGSQRLRLFLVPLNEPESPSSIEGRVTHPMGPDSQFVFAVNGMLDRSPRKSSSGQSLTSQTSHLGNASDYSPTFHRDTSTSAFTLENKDVSLSSSNLSGTSSKHARQFLGTLQIPQKSFIPSPPLSPVQLQHRDLKNSNVQLHLDQPYCHGNGGIALSDVDAVGYINNLDHGPPLMNYHQHNKNLAETYLTKKSHNMPSLNRSASEDFVPSAQYGQGGMNFERYMPLRKPLIHSDKSVSHPKDILELLLPTGNIDASHQKIMHVLSDSRLHEHLERSLEGENVPVPLNLIREGSPSLEMPSSSQEREAQLVDQKNKMVTHSNQFNISTPHHCKQEEGLELFSHYTNDTSADKKWKHFGGNVEVTSNDAVMEFKNLLNMNYLKDAVDSQEYKLDTTSQYSHRIQNGTNDQQCSTTISGQSISRPHGLLTVASQEFLISSPQMPTSSASDREYSLHDNYPEYVVEKVGSGRHSFEDPKYEDVCPVQSQPLDNHNDNKVTKSVVIVEDLTNSTPPGIPASKAVYRVSHLEDETSDECSSPTETEISAAPESEGKGVTADGKHRHETITDAAIAEMEAGIYGLQIIKNADLEELQELGSGTFGTVYHGKWRGTDVAIKRIKKSCFSDRSSEQERLTKDFWREAKILSTLHHPNVVALYGVVPDGPGGTLATVAEFMVNGSLRHVLVRKDRVLDRRKRLIILMDTAFGMEYLHLKNIVHFDLKCDNLLVNLRDPERPICKVADFGLSRIKRNTLVSGGVRGTLPWMAPELLNGSSSRVSEKVDVFSFGIVMWEILTGEEPYANMHCGAIIGGIVNNTLRPPIPKRCDLEWKKLMEECWSPDPADRPSFTDITHRLRDMSTALQKKRSNVASR